jgi:L-rhamnose mutarotase
MTQLLRSVAAVGIDPARLEEYLEVHRNQPEAVRRSMQEAGIASYRMHLIRSRAIMVAISERRADTLAADKQRMALDPVMHEWLATCRAMQLRLEGERSEAPSLWSPLPEVYAL